MESKVYPEMYLDADMEDMGYIFEYCEIFCLELFNVEIDRMKFLNAFMRLRLRKEMEEGHAHLLTEAAKDTIETYINIDCKGNIEQFKKVKENNEKNNEKNNEDKYNEEKMK